MLDVYVANGHSIEWARWWIVFSEAFTGKLTRAEERSWFLVGDTEAWGRAPVEGEPLSLGL